jgi:hypothetical protein
MLRRPTPSATPFSAIAFAFGEATGCIANDRSNVNKNTRSYERNDTQPTVGGGPKF